MAHSHSEHSGAGHSHAPNSFNTAFVIGIALNLGFVVIEFWFGKVSHSLALVSDAGHNLSDVLSLALALGATFLTKTAPTSKRTFGMRRSSILAALINAAVLLLAIGAIAWEAVGRFQHPSPVEGKTVMLVAGIGIAVNAVTALLFWSGRSHDLNIRGAFLHMAADAAVSVGVLLSGAAMLYTGWLWLDPVVSLVIVVVIFFATWNLLKDSVTLAMDFVPEGIDLDGITAYLETLPDVLGVHDTHIWALSTTETALTAHVVLKNGADFSDKRLLSTEAELHGRFGIEHSTLQFEGLEAAALCKCRLSV